MWRLIALSLTIAACGGNSNDYDATVDYFVRNAAGLEFYANGTPAEAVPAGALDSVDVLVDRHYDSYAAAEGAPPIRLEAVRNGATVWSVMTNPALCSNFAAECGDIVRAEHTDCRDGSDGSRIDLCAGLSCYDHTGMCGGWISGPPPPARLRARFPDRASLRRSRASGSTR